MIVMYLEEALKNNEKFVRENEAIKFSHYPKKKLAIFTCMDTRLTNFLEPALGIGRGDAKIIRNAGNTIVDEDAIRSIAAAIFSLKAEEVMVIGHTECGMANSDIEALKKSMLDKGISIEEIEKVDLEKWIGCFGDEEENVIDSVEKIKNHPLIPDSIPVHGLILDIVSGKLKVLVNDN